MGAVGLPEFDKAPPSSVPKRGLLGMRRVLDVFANLRPVRTWQALVDSSPLKNQVVEGTDMIIVRELTGGLYYGKPRGMEGDEDRGFNTMTYTRKEVERVSHMAFKLARNRRKKVTSVDKSNVLEDSQFWRKVVIEVAQQLSGHGARSHAGGQLRHANGAESPALRRDADRKYVRRYSER